MSDQNPLPLMHRLTAGNLIDDRRGNVFVLFALMAPVVLGIIGLAVDYERAYSLNARLQATADSTALSATRGIGDGMTTDNATALAQTVWSSNLVGANGNIPKPAIDYTISNGAVSAKVSYSATVNTTFGQLLNIKSIPLSGTAVAQAGLQATTYRTYAGWAEAYGDPHMKASDNYTAGFMCPNPYWYNMLTDSQVQVNVYCNHLATGPYTGTDIISDMVVQLGTHKISLHNIPPNADLDSSQDWVWHGQVTIDGTVYNPIAGYSVLASWPVGEVDAHITDGGDPSQYQNDHLTINTPQYQISLFFNPGGEVYFSTTNAGNCGVAPGGLLGDTLSGVNDTTASATYADTVDVSAFAVPSSTWTGPQFKTSTCSTTTVSQLRLSR